MPFRVVIIGGTGQVGAAVVRALVALPSCAEVVLVNRKATPLTANDRLRQVILDTGAAGFQAEVTKLAMRTTPSANLDFLTWIAQGAEVASTAVSYA